MWHALDARRWCHRRAYAAIDVSLEWSSVCVVDAAGEIVHEAKAPSEQKPGFLEPHSEMGQQSEIGGTKGNR